MNGTLIGMAGGATAGTTVFPFYGTIAGFFAGMMVGVVGGLFVGGVTASLVTPGASVRRTLADVQLFSALVAVGIVAVGTLALAVYGEWHDLNPLNLLIVLGLCLPISVGAAWSAGDALRRSVTQEQANEIAAGQFGFYLRYGHVLLVAAVPGAVGWLVIGVMEQLTI